MENLNTLPQRAIATLRDTEQLTVKYGVGDRIVEASVLLTGNPSVLATSKVSEFTYGVKRPWGLGGGIGGDAPKVDMASVKRAIARALSREGASTGYVISAVICDELGDTVENPSSSSTAPLFLLATISHD